MERNRVYCTDCHGTGYKKVYKLTSHDEATGRGTAELTEVVCESCNGKCYTDYAIFTFEEAEAILKYCGLSTKKEINTSNCSGCIYEDSYGSSVAISNCVCCNRNVPFAKNDNYKEK